MLDTVNNLGNLYKSQADYWSFDTDKTTFFTHLAQALCCLNRKVLICYSSNAAIDNLALKIEEADP